MKVGIFLLINTELISPGASTAKQVPQRAYTHPHPRVQPV